MKLTIKRELTSVGLNGAAEPTPLATALQMFYDGMLVQLAQEINDEVLADSGLEPQPFVTMELELTTKGKTLLVIRTDAIKTPKDDEL
ncbi:hypothetical protein FDH48_gp53 [Arthrobacter phage Jawnski]|uniref:Uncharacterized protein n=3 Tax=Jawnskivirus TaxID=3425003 RepID=A0A222Z3I3_9CAUD|nr:hypothetical protein FDH47_gp54 [Arthrobacter phage Brent]YP_009601613.1 hypothetical protein FDH48_gp53 [Arthrobacter phage Jawnski]ALF01265.1 hypothetical protein SEA_BRENT_54 [Arthrobacter phage Brent]ALY09382.1 hypothetical protein JAWNSKI_53 [Arthrobacter phage Jawnski]ASR78155.1 hypothetical protein SEA_FRANZY_54 [Arthrobacter phage Franzy]